MEVEPVFCLDEFPSDLRVFHRSEEEFIYGLQFCSYKIFWLFESSIELWPILQLFKSKICPSIQGSVSTVPA